MKKVGILLVVLLCLVGCRDDVQQIAGTYSYKISGSALLDSAEISLRTEQGAMEVIPVTNEKAMVTFNPMNGDVYYTTMYVQGKNLTCSYSRSVRYSVRDYKVQVEGKGYVYDNTLLFTLHYYNEDYSFVADSLVLLCKKN